MLEINRTVRFCLNDAPPAPGKGADPFLQAAARTNSFSAWPAMRGLGRYYELMVGCRGEADPQTGYFINIKHIDQAVWRYALPRLDAARAEAAIQDAMGELMRDLIAGLQPPLDNTVVSLTLCLTPRYHLTIESSDMDHVILSQQYEFSAAHRLHVPGFSDERNREIFGKCNNPAGHGHNYQVQVAVRTQIDPRGRVIEAQDLDAVVDSHCIQKLDHKHLNMDVPEFANLNPSVEHIAKVIWAMLENPIAAMDGQERVKLEEIRVSETSKTACTYRGPAVAS